MRTRVTMTPGAVERMVDRRGAQGAAAAARFLEAEQKRMTTSRRIRDEITSGTGRDARGWYARAGMPSGAGRSAGWIWIFHEYQTGQGPPGRPFLRPSLESNTSTVARLLSRGGL